VAPILSRKVFIVHGHDEASRESVARFLEKIGFELGFFIGILDPACVAALVNGDVEHPSAFEGVVFLSLSLDNGDWKTGLSRELEAAGYEVDLFYFVRLHCDSM